jgi:hypothetical protein
LRTPAPGVCRGAIWRCVAYITAQEPAHTPVCRRTHLIVATEDAYFRVLLEQSDGFGHEDLITKFGQGGTRERERHGQREQNAASRVSFFATLESRISATKTFPKSAKDVLNSAAN